MIPVGAFHAPAMAALHAEAFSPAERWDEAAFAALLATPGAFGVLDPRGGFALAREAADEAELLTVAVVPAARRRGIGRGLLAAIAAHCGGALFLEVAADNTPALRLYAGSGFEPCGRRPDYYGRGRDALVLRRPPG